MSIPTVLYGHVRAPTGSNLVEPGPKLPVTKFAFPVREEPIESLPTIMAGSSGLSSGSGMTLIGPVQGVQTGPFDNRFQFAAIVPAMRAHPLRWLGRFVGRPITPPTVNLPSPVGLPGLFRGM